MRDISKSQVGWWREVGGGSLYGILQCTCHRDKGAFYLGRTDPGVLDRGYRLGKECAE